MAATATIPGSATTLPIHRLDLATYNRIVASGVLEGQRIQLLDGLVVEMSPQSPRHASAIEALTRHFGSADAHLRVQLPLEVPPDSEPEPDVALVAERPPPGEHPRTALLVVEVAVTSQEINRCVKAPLYARAGVAVYWLVDVPARAVEVCTEPKGDRYGHCERHAGAATLSCPVEGVADLPLATLFG